MKLRALVNLPGNFVMGYAFTANALDNPGKLPLNTRIVIYDVYFYTDDGTVYGPWASLRSVVPGSTLTPDILWNDLPLVHNFEVGPVSLRRTVNLTRKETFVVLEKLHRLDDRSIRDGSIYIWVPEFKQSKGKPYEYLKEDGSAVVVHSYTQGTFTDRENITHTIITGRHDEYEPTPLGRTLDAVRTLLTELNMIPVNFREGFSMRDLARLKDNYKLLGELLEGKTCHLAKTA